MKNFNSIKKKQDFDKVYKNKKFFLDENFILYIIEKNDIDIKNNRIGISVSKKIGNSVERHKIIRRIREIFRLNENRLKKYYDIVVVARKNSKFVNYEKLNTSFIKLCKKQKIYMEDYD